MEISRVYVIVLDLLTGTLTLGQSNILVDMAGHARITDFGLAIVIQDPSPIRNTSPEHGQTGRWIAPEILDSQGAYSKEADVFSFAGVAIEVRHTQLVLEARK